jgi:hypothetical protein
LRKKITEVKHSFLPKIQCCTVKNESFTSSAELSPLLSNGLLNHWEKSSDELNILGNRKFKSAQSSSRLFFKEKRNMLAICHICT